MLRRAQATCHLLSRGLVHPNRRPPVRRFFLRNGADLYQGFVALLLSSGGDLITGSVLGSMTNTLQRLPGLLILVPAAIGMRGNIFGALGSRLGTAIHTGQYRDPLSRRSPAGQSVVASALLTVYISGALGLLAWLVARLFGVHHISVTDFIAISVLGGVGSSVVVLGVTVVVAQLSVRHGWDLDNVSTPIVTTIGDLVTLPALWLASFAVFVRGFTIFVTLMAAVVAASCLAWQNRQPAGGLLRTVIRQSAPLLVVAGLLDIVAGYALDTRTERFFTLPALLVLVAPFLEDAGALGGILSARLGSKLHLGLLRPSLFPDRRCLDDLVVLGILAVPVFTLVAVSSTLVAAGLGLAGPGIVKMLGVSLLAGLFATAGGALVAYYTAIGTYRLGLDPDNFGIPLITSSTDVVGTLSIVAAILIMGLA